MKKVMLILAAAVMAATASAQVVTSRTYVKTEKPTTWYGRLGVSFDNAAGCNDYFSGKGSRVGMDIDFGFQRPMGNFGLYWGMELGIGTRGYALEEENIETGSVNYYGYTRTEETQEHILAWNVKYSPFTFGYKYSVTDNIKIDAHFGLFLSYDFAGSYSSEYKSSYSIDGGTTHNNGESDLSWGDFKDQSDYQSFDAGMQIGAGVWFNRFNLDFTYQRGFVPMYNDWDDNLYSSNFMIRLGVAF